MKLWKVSRCDECGKKIDIGVMLEQSRRGFDILVICAECLEKARELLLDATPCPGCTGTLGNHEVGCTKEAS
jgi:hypothetical protein